MVVTFGKEGGGRDRKGRGEGFGGLAKFLLCGRVGCMEIHYVYI